MTQPGSPTIGRIVHYQLSAGDVAAIERKYPPVGTPDRAPQRNAVSPSQLYPAMVVRDFGGAAVNLQVFLDGDCSYWATSRCEGDVPGTWAWPTRS